jgi:hypothetical protein
MRIVGCVLLCVAVAQVGGNPKGPPRAPVPPFIAAHAHCRLCDAVCGCGAGGREPQRPAAARMLQRDLALTAHAHCRLCGAVRGCGAGGREPQGPAAARLFQHDPGQGAPAQHTHRRGEGQSTFPGRIKT